MTRLTLVSGLEPAMIPTPPPPPTGAQVGAEDWSVDGVMVGRAFIQSYIDYVFEGEFSSMTLEWIALSEFTLPSADETPDPNKTHLGTLKPISLEEETSSLGRKSFLFVDGEEKEHAELCVSLLARGHSHVLATVRRYERGKPGLPDGVDEEELKDVCLRWSWTPKMRQSIQRICRQMDDDEDHYVVCSESMASRTPEDICPMISVRRVSMTDVEDVKAEARVWLDVVEVNAKSNDADEEPFGTRDTVTFKVSVDAKDMQKVVTGKVDEIAHQVFVILSCFT